MNGNTFKAKRKIENSLRKSEKKEIFINNL